MSVFQPSDFGPPFGADFIPNLQNIIDITQAQEAVVTFSTDHNFFLWQWISFRVPPSNGMVQLNNRKAQIIDFTPDTVTIDLDTLQFYPFISVENGQIPCVAVAAGSGVNPIIATMILDDAFDNRPVI